MKAVTRSKARAGVRAMVTLCLGSLASSVALAQSAVMPVPPSAQVSLVGERMVVNGLPASLRELEVRGTRDDVLGFYRARLIRRADAPVISQDGHDILSGWHQGHYVTVVVSDAKKSGFVTARLLQTDMKTPGVRRPPANLPAGSQVHSQVDSLDGGRVSSLLVFSNLQSVDANVNHVTSTLKQSMGMRVIEDSAHPISRDARVVYLTNDRGADSVLTISTDNGRRVVTLNTMSAGLASANANPSTTVSERQVQR